MVLGKDDALVLKESKDGIFSIKALYEILDQTSTTSCLLILFGILVSLLR